MLSCFSFAHAKGNLHLQNSFMIPLIAMAGGTRAWLTVCYIFQIIITGSPFMSGLK